MNPVNNQNSVNKQSQTNHQIEEPTAQSSNERNFAVHSLFFGGVVLTSILSVRAVIAKTTLRAGFLTLGALTSSTTSLAASYSCNDPETTDVKSFSKKFKSLFRPIEDEVLEHVSIPEISLWGTIDRVGAAVHQCGSFVLEKMSPKE